MQNYCKTIGALAAASALVAGNALAGTPTPAPAPVTQPAPAIEYELHTGYSSAYLYRGLNLGQDLIEVGADVKMNLSGFNLSAGAWYGTVNGSNFTRRQMPSSVPSMRGKWFVLIQNVCVRLKLQKSSCIRLAVIVRSPVNSLTLDSRSVLLRSGSEMATNRFW